ncbi:MAG TPA: hypothetical protein VGL24_04395 [Chthoniobacterales bacterium]
MNMNLQSREFPHKISTSLKVLCFSDDTTIVTDPTITTNDTTDFGTIYRGEALDGPAAAWFFGSTSAFDEQVGFINENLFMGDRLPAMNVSNTGEQLALLDGAATGPNGKITIPAATRSSGNLNGTNSPAWLKADQTFAGNRLATSPKLRVRCPNE